MPAKLDLKATFLDGLESRGIPRSQRGVYVGVLGELARFLSARAPTQWSHADLEAFMTAHAPRVPPAERPVYGAALALLADILAGAERRGAELYLDLADGSRTHFDAKSSGRVAALPPAQPPAPVADLAAADDDLGLLEPDAAPEPAAPEADPAGGRSAARGGDPDELGLLDLDSDPVAPSSARVEVVVADSGDRIEFVDEEADADELPIELRPTAPLLRKPERRRRGGPRISQSLSVPGWRSRSRMLQENDVLVVDERYTLDAALPEATAFEVRSAPRPGAQEELCGVHRGWLLATGGLLALAIAGFIVHWLLGLALVALAMVSASAVAMAMGAALRLDRTEPRATEPLEAVRQYVAALRVGLYHRARELLAVPRDTTPLGTEELLAAGREHGLGRRFNTLSPAGLRVYWRRRIGELDDAERGRLGQLRERFLDPTRLHLEELMRRDDGSACIAVLRAGQHDAYAIVPVVQLHGSWYVADGQCRLRASRIELLERLGRHHVAGNIDDDGFVAACRRHNLTRADITRGRLEGALSETQASMLVQRTLRVGDSGTEVQQRA